jgi:hypothetical protein
MVIPSVLLIDIPVESEKDGDVTPTPATIADSGAGLDRAKRPALVKGGVKAAAPTEVSTRKVVMMKRDTSSDTRGGKKELPSKQAGQGATDKAKQYAEAKARIFGVSVGEGDKDGADQVGADDIAAHKPSDKSTIVAEVSSTSNTVVEVIGSSKILSVTPSLTPGALSSKSNSVNPTSHGQKKGKKAVERDRGADEKDPDFMRRSYGNSTGQSKGGNSSNSISRNNSS